MSSSTRHSPAGPAVVTVTAAAPGEMKTLEIKQPLEPGEYAMLCPIGGPDGPHHKLGRLVEFEIQ